MDIRNVKALNDSKMTIFSTLSGDTYFVTKKEGATTYVVTGGSIIGAAEFSVFNDTMINRNGHHYIMATVNFGNMLSSLVIDDMVDELKLFTVDLPVNSANA